jgi:hypothetical protein
LLSLFGSVPAASADRPSADCGPIPAAADNQAMRLTVERRRDMDILHVEGRIAADLPQRMKRLFAENRRIGEIWLNSSGGDWLAAIDTGRFIRANEIYLTRVPAGAACVEACGLLFLSGRIRALHPDSVFDVGPLPSDVPRTGEADAQAAEMAAARETDILSGYLLKMGVSRRLLSEVILRSPGEDRGPRPCLTQQEIRRYNVANSNQ